MSIFANTRNLSPPKQKPLNLDEERASTNEQARPVPYFAGIARLGVTFLSDAFDVYSTKVRIRVGKKKQIYPEPDQRPSDRGRGRTLAPAVLAHGR